MLGYPQIGLDLLSMFSAGLLSRSICEEVLGNSAHLIGKVRHHDCRCLIQIVREEAKVAQRTKLKGKPEAVMGSAGDGKLGKVGAGQREIGDQILLGDLY